MDDCPSLPGSPCVQPGNPNLQRSCVRCGRRIVRRISAPARRSLELERNLTEQAARDFTDPDRMIAHAETRACTLSSEYVADPMLILPGRDRPRDAREEAADGRNHLVFHMQEHPDDPDNPRYMRALRYFALAYAELHAD